MPQALAGNTVNAQDILDTLEATAPSTWTPTWTSLTKGTGSAEEGWSLQIGRLMVAQYTITLGTSPSYAASISFTLPADCITGTGDVNVGTWTIRDDSALDWYTGTVNLLTAGTARLLGAWTGTVPNERVGVTSSTPVTPASGDKITLNLSYLTAS